MTEHPQLKIEQDGKLLRITLNRPEDNGVRLPDQRPTPPKISLPRSSQTTHHGAIALDKNQRSSVSFSSEKANCYRSVLECPLCFPSLWPEA